MSLKQLLVIAFSILLAGPSFGRGPDSTDPISRSLFKPELIMRFSTRLNLSDQQQELLRSELKNAQSAIFDLKWQMNEESTTLKAMLKDTPINEELMLEQADKVMSLEHQVKRINLSLLARLKNMLSDEQIAMLRELRRERANRADNTGR